MSRSYKHTPVYKGGKNKNAKRQANKDIRHKTKDGVDLCIAGKSNAYRKEYESWNICDYRIWGDHIWRKESLQNVVDDKNLWEKCYRRK